MTHLPVPSPLSILTDPRNSRWEREESGINAGDGGEFTGAWGSRRCIGVAACRGTVPFHFSPAATEKLEKWKIERNGSSICWPSYPGCWSRGPGCNCDPCDPCMYSPGSVRSVSHVYCVFSAFLTFFQECLSESESGQQKLQIVTSRGELLCSILPEEKIKTIQQKVQTAKNDWKSFISSLHQKESALEVDFYFILSNI